MKEYYDLIILVIANETNDNCYNDFINEYWIKLINYVKHNSPNIKIFLLFGEKPTNKNIDDSDILVSNTKESLRPGILKKTIYAFEYCNNTYNYKHILRTNLSTFYVLDKLILMNNNLNDKGLYGGLKFNWGIGGSGMWLSSDVITYIISNKDKLNYGSRIYDDVAIGRLINNNFNKIDLPILIIDRRTSKKYKNKELIIEEIIKNNHYNIRNKRNPHNRYEDIEMIKYLWKFFYEDSK